MVEMKKEENQNQIFEKHPNIGFMYSRNICLLSIHFGSNGIFLNSMDAFLSIKTPNHLLFPIK